MDIERLLISFTVYLEQASSSRTRLPMHLLPLFGSKIRPARWVVLVAPGS